MELKNNVLLLKIAGVSEEKKTSGMKNDMACRTKEKQSNTVNTGVKLSRPSGNENNRSFRDHMKCVEKTADSTQSAAVENKKECVEKQSTQLTNKQQVEAENRDASEFAARYCETIHPQIKSEAVEVLKDVLVEVGSFFGISTDGIAQIQNFNLDEGEKTAAIAQFAEILSVLKSMKTQVASALQEGIPIDIQGVELSSTEAANLDKLLSKAIFKAEFAFEMLGIGGEVKKQCDELIPNLGTGAVSEAGLPVAVAPDTIESLTKEQFDQVVMPPAADRIKSIIARIVELATSQNGTTSKETSPVERMQDLSGLDTRVIRKLLGIDENKATVNEIKTEPDSPIQTSGEKKQEFASGTAILRSFPEQPEKAKETKTGELVQMQKSEPADSELVDTENLSSPVKITSMKDRMIAPLEQQQSNIPVQTKAVLLSTSDSPVQNVHRPTQTDEPVIQQVVRQVIAAVKNGSHEVRLVLRPESLGDVRMKVQVDGDVVMARITVESLQVKQIIESSMQHLKDALAEHNLQTGTMDVTVGHDPKDSQEQGASSNGNDKNEDENGTDANTDQEMKVGIETGRRFGSNSMEFFA